MSGSLLALTFHGQGDPAIVHGAMDAFVAAQVQVTMFAVGTWLVDNIQLGKDFIAAGHALGNHTWSHQKMPDLSLAAATDEAKRGADAVARVLGDGPGLLFRPSATHLSTPTIRAAARAAGYHRCISYNVDPLDYQDPGAAAVLSRTLARVHPGAIVSLHFGHAGTLAALPRLLDGLASRGLTSVTIPQLVKGLS